MNIKAKWMLFSFILILSTTLIIGISSYYRFSRIVVQGADNAVVRLAQESAQSLDNYISQFTTPLVGLSEKKEIVSMDWQKQKAVILTQIYPQYQNVAVVDLDGIAHYTDNTVLDLSDRSYVKETLKGKIAFSDIVVSRKTGQPVIMAGVPIIKNGVLKGALIARLDVNFLSDYALTRGYGKNGRAYIISNVGTLISRPIDDKVDKCSEYDLYKMAKKYNKYKAFAEFVKNSKNQQSGFGEYLFNNSTILMGYATTNETHWKIYIGTYKSDVLDSLNGLKNMFIIIVLFSIICCTIAAWFFVDKFTKPIVELDDLFSRGARGDLTIRFTPKTKDEIGRVGISFNHMMDKIKTLTQYDPLTGLLNQYVLEKDIETFVHSDEVHNFTLVMTSIEKLSLINDTFGYGFGDKILIEVAKRIMACCPEEAVYRYKGNEFVILCSEAMEKKMIEEKANKLLEELLKSYQVNNKTIDVNINMGVFLWDEDSRTEEPIKAVTQAVNYAKTLGSNQVKIFDRQTHNKIKQTKEIQADIITGLKQDQFFLVFQPLFDLENENIAELEALIRWNHPEKGMIYPDKFIDLAEAAGTILYIDQWVIESACKLLRSWKDSKKQPVMLSINISAKTFEMENFIPELLKIIHFYGIDPKLLQLEITERLLIKNVEESINKLKELRTQGIHVAIDDFGIGYSSLNYIVRLPIDSIKIDKSFVQEITSSKEAMAIVSTIINLCKTLNLNVIAEGIEKKTELEYLKSNRCDIGQGYYFSKPVSLTEIEKYF